MNYTQERIIYGLGNIVASMFFTLGAIFTPGESRWLFVTLASAVLMSAMLSLTFKRADETIRLVIGRGGISILCGIFLSKPLVLYFGIHSAETDIVILGACAALSSIFGFILGFAGLEYLIKKSDAIAKRFIDAKVDAFIPPENKP